MLKCRNHRAFVAAAAVFFDAEVADVLVMFMVFFVVVFTLKVVVVMVMMSVVAVVLCIVTLLISQPHSVEKVHRKASSHTDCYFNQNNFYNLRNLTVKWRISSVSQTISTPRVISLRRSKTFLRAAAITRIWLSV